ncbi:MAG TPA: hypothetical protein VJU83_09660 [Burkholderiales bacterium]|nr:hypothetical protein [Burkholderiales bacterium]
MTHVQDEDRTKVIEITPEQAREFEAAGLAAPSVLREGGRFYVHSSELCQWRNGIGSHQPGAANGNV